MALYKYNNSRTFCLLSLTDTKWFCICKGSLTFCTSSSWEIFWSISWKLDMSLKKRQLVLLALISSNLLSYFPCYSSPCKSIHRNFWRNAFYVFRSKQAFAKICHNIVDTSFYLFFVLFTIKLYLIESVHSFMNFLSIKINSFILTTL